MPSAVMSLLRCWTNSCWPWFFTVQNLRIRLRRCQTWIDPSLVRQAPIPQAPSPHHHHVELMKQETLLSKTGATACLMVRTYLESVVLHAYASTSSSGSMQTNIIGRNDCMRQLIGTFLVLTMSFRISRTSATTSATGKPRFVWSNFMTIRVRL